MATKAVRLVVDAGGRGHVFIDGEELRNVLGCKIYAHAGDLTVVELTLANVSAHADVTVDTDLLRVSHEHQ